MLLDLMFGFTKQWSHSCAIPGWLILAIAAVFLLCFWLGLFRWALKDHHEKATQLPKSWKWWEIGACLLTAAIIWWILWYFEAIESWTYPEAFLVMLIVGLGLLMKLVIGNILLAGLSTGPYRLQEVYERTYFNVEYGYLLGWGLSFCLFGSLPWINTLLAFLATDNTAFGKRLRPRARLALSLPRSAGPYGTEKVSFQPWSHSFFV